MSTLTLSGGVVIGASGEPVGDSAQGSPPSVSFLDDRPLALKAESLVGKGLEVEIHNDLGRDQNITLRVVGPEGSEDEAVRTFFSEKETQRAVLPTKQPVPPGGTVILKLPVTSALPETDTASFEAELVASGESGGLARRELTVSLEKPKPEDTSEIGADEDSVANVLDPAQAVEVTLVAINFLPSPLANATSFGFFLIVLLGFAILALHRQLRRRDDRLPLLLGAVAVLIGIVITVVLVSQGDWDQPSVHAISSRPIPVASELNGVSVGAATSESGKLAQIEVANKEMRPQGLEGAGSFKGTYDLTPGADGGDAAANIKVRDFWLYAVLAIAAGLAIAYSLQRWYEQTRPGWKVRLRFQGMRNRYRGRNEELKKKREKAPYNNLSLEGRFDRLWTEVKEKLDESDRAGASKLLDDMAGYLNKYYRLWVALESLYLSSAELKELWESHSFDLEPADLKALATAQQLLGGAAEVTSPEQDAEALSTKLKMVEEQDAFVRELSGVFESVVRHLKATRSLLPHPGTHEKDLKDLEQKLEKLGVRTLKVKGAEALGKIEQEDSDAGTELLHLAKQIKGEQPQQSVRMEVGDPKLFRVLSRGEIRALDAEFLEELDDAVELSSLSEGQILEARGGGDAESVEAEERNLADHDRVVAVTAFTLAVASGMTLLYLNEPAWGEPIDYLSALVWGGISGAGVKLATSIADRVLSGS